MAPPPAPAKAGRGPLFWSGVGCCGCLALIGLGFLGMFGSAWFFSSGAVEAARTQLKEIREGNLEAAYGRFSAGYQADHPASAFTAFVEKHPGLKSNTDSTFNNRSFKNETAKISGTLAHAAGTENVTYDLVKEGNAWKVSGLEVEGDSGLPGAPNGGGPVDGGLVVETTGIDKKPQGQGVTIDIDVRVTGFDVRPEGSLFRMELSEDLETLGPDGERIADLSRVGLRTLNDTVKQSTDVSGDFKTTLNFGKAAPGRYKAIITIRDMVGLKMKKHEVPFDLP